MADDGWFVKGAPKKKATPSPKAPGGVLRTGESANRGPATPKKFPATSPANTPNRSKSSKPKPTFENRNDDSEYIYDPSKLTWSMPHEVFEKIIVKYPALKTLNFLDYISRWSLMRQMENAHWFYTDDLVNELSSLGLKEVPALEFFAALLQQLVSVASVVPHYSPARYTDEWQYWQKYCRVGGMTVVRINEETKEYETLMVKNVNKWFAELSTTWPGSKAELEDNSFWALAVREMKVETGLDLSGDRTRVAAVLEGNRATQVVVVLDANDSRFATMKPKDGDIHSIFWVPISQLDLTTVKEPAKETRPADASTGASPAKEDPKEFRMPWEVKELFKKLQSVDLTQRQEGLEISLDLDPRSTLVSHSQSNPPTPSASPAPSLRSSQC